MLSVGDECWDPWTEWRSSRADSAFWTGCARRRGTNSWPEVTCQRLTNAQVRHGVDSRLTCIYMYMWNMYNIALDSVVSCNCLERDPLHFMSSSVSWVELETQQLNLVNAPILLNSKSIEGCCRDSSDKYVTNKTIVQHLHVCMQQERWDDDMQQ